METNTNVEQRGNITIEGMEQDERNSQKVKTTSAFDTSNYLDVKLNDDEDEKVLKIRLLPIDKDANSPFKRIYTHSMKLKPEQRGKNQSEWKSFVCLSKTEDIDHDVLGCKCPFCEENRKAYQMFKDATNDVDKNRWKQISLGYLASETGIVRCIERSHEDDGPKFWKFSIRQDGLDPMSMIKRCYKTALEESIDEGEEPLNILDVYRGKDLKVTIKAIYDREGKRTNKTSVTIEPYGKIKPLSEDELQIQEWVNDPKVWSDVFVAKPYEYLSIMIDGKMPYFDKAAKVWIVNPNSNSAQTQKVMDANEKIAQAQQAAIAPQPNTATTIASEDLPF